MYWHLNEKEYNAYYYSNDYTCFIWEKGMSPSLVFDSFFYESNGI